MKKHLIILCIIFAQFAHTRKIDLNLNQPQLIKVFAQDTESLKTVKNILSTFDLYYETTDRCLKGDNSLYILAGSTLNIEQHAAPDNYIVFHTKEVKTINNELLARASAIWDASWGNINRYKNSASHYYYLPDENYSFLDPVILSCYLPLKALPAYKKLLQYSNTVNTDISSHVPTLFCHAYALNPSIMVEAGVRGDEGSNVALQAAAKPFKSHLIGIDVNDDSRVYQNIPNATFLQMDDRNFINRFKKMNLPKKTIDFVFIDTSHEYQHTVDEIQVFKSILSENGALGFHDSNVTPLQRFSAYSRLNGTLQTGIWGNPRGVAPAIKGQLGVQFDETQYVNKTFIKDGYTWRFIHYPFCNGLTIAKRLHKN